MAIIAKEVMTRIEPISEGVHVGICYGVVDIGSQYSKQYDKTARKVIIMWEISDETYTDKDGNEQPRTLSREYTLSLNEKSGLRKMLEQWRSRKFTEEERLGFDLMNIVGLPCQITVIHEEKNGNTYANMSGIMVYPKGAEPPKQHNASIYFDTTDKTLSQLDEEMKILPEWIQNKIKESDEYKTLTTAPSNWEPAESDDLPF